MSNTNTLTVVTNTNTDITDPVFGPDVRGTAGPVPQVDPDFTLTLPRAVFELHRFASKDAGYFALTHIQIRQIGAQFAGQFIASASDGHRLCQVNFTAQPSDSFGLFPASVLLPAHLLKACKPGKKSGTGMVSAVGDAMRIQTGDLVGECDTDAGFEFPDIGAVVPMVNTGTGCPLAGFNLTYLADVAALVKAVSGSTPAISWPADNVSPMRIDIAADDSTIVYVQMPMRL